jgi:hypothetical protein
MVFLVRIMKCFAHCSLSFFLSSLLFIQVIAASAAAFIGLGFAILLISALAVVFLWFYGSFWTTSSVIILGGHILHFS